MRLAFRHGIGGVVFSMSMTNEFKPLIRDPHQPANMLQEPPRPESRAFPEIDVRSTVPTERESNRKVAELDPLIRHPRVSSMVLCVVFGLILLACAAGIWWLGVRTLEGQSYEDMVWSQFASLLPAWLEPVVNVFVVSDVVAPVSYAVMAAALVVLIVRKRWIAIAQSAVFGIVSFVVAESLKATLPRPYLINLESNSSNSAPSGHVALAAIAGVILLCAVPRMLRALVAVLGWLYATLIGLSVVAGQWHRTTDVIMALLIVGGFAMLSLSWTFSNGMDQPGKRASSPAVQIVGSALLTIGVLGTLYGAYIVWQVEPGLALSAEWTYSGACFSSAVLIASVGALVFGLVLAMRQLTASPLTKLGLVGAPPAPPKR